jgi:hypothetical protein
LHALRGQIGHLADIAHGGHDLRSRHGFSNCSITRRPS